MASHSPGGERDGDDRRVAVFRHLGERRAIAPTAGADDRERLPPCDGVDLDLPHLWAPA